MKDALCQPCNVDQCQTCEQFTDTTGNTIMRCKTCSEKYTLNSDSCGICPRNCKKCRYDKKYICEECYDKFAVSSNGQCIQCPENCAECSASSNQITKCTKCISNEYQLQSDGQCKRCEAVVFPNCKTCSKESNGKEKCDSCFSGFALKHDGGSCVHCQIDNCKLCVEGNICKKCQNGFYHYNYQRECASLFVFHVCILRE